jgi:hypothetical protein
LARLVKAAKTTTKAIVRDNVDMECATNACYRGWKIRGVETMT